jgi:hypothetical protein
MIHLNMRDRAPFGISLIPTPDGRTQPFVIEIDV